MLRAANLGDDADTTAAIAGQLSGAVHPWEFDRALHAWWVEPGALLAGEYPGHAEPTAAHAELALLVDAGVRHVRHPIPDFDVIDTDDCRSIIETIKREIADDRPVFVHAGGVSAGPAP